MIVVIFRTHTSSFTDEIIVYLQRWVDPTFPTFLGTTEMKIVCVYLVEWM